MHKRMQGLEKKVKWEWKDEVTGPKEKKGGQRTENIQSKHSPFILPPNLFITPMDQ